MTKSLAQLQAQIARLQKEADAARAKEVRGVVSRIREAIEAYGLTSRDLFDVPRSKPTANPRRARGDGTKPNGSKLAGRKVAVKYRDAKGNTWTGRGNKPRWLAAALAEGKKLDSFAV